MKYSFCEPVMAGVRATWHIRPLTKAGRKLGGGIDTASLCGWVVRGNGWDIDVPITEHHLKHACQKCVALYQRAIGATSPAGG